MDADGWRGLRDRGHYGRDADGARRNGCRCRGSQTVVVSSCNHYSRVVSDAHTPTRCAERVPFNDLQRVSTAKLDRLLDVARRVIARGYYLLGPETHGLEAEWAESCMVSHCVAVANGTDALEIALRSVGCEPADEVVVVANAGMYATVACIAIGAVPVFADVDPSSLLLSTSRVASLVTRRTCAVVATHLYGNVVDVEALRAVLPDSVAIVEDAAQAHDARLRGTPVGGLGDVAAFSFYPTKNLGALGDAGAVVTNDDDVARRARALRQYGWDARYVATVPHGRNSRIDEIQAAFLRELLPDLAARNARRCEIATRYDEAFGARLPPVRSNVDGAEPTFHLCVVRSRERERLAARARERGHRHRGALSDARPPPTRSARGAVPARRARRDRARLS